MMKPSEFLKFITENKLDQKSHEEAREYDRR